jgi:hypothetical protein
MDEETISITELHPRHTCWTETEQLLGTGKVIEHYCSDWPASYVGRVLAERLASRSLPLCNACSNAREAAPEYGLQGFCMRLPRNTPYVQPEG